MHYKVWIAAPLLACVANCATVESMGAAEKISTVAGGVIGGVIGNKLGDENKAIWTAVGLTAGAFIGKEIGKYLDDREKEQVAQATVSAAESGETRAWSNPESGISGKASVVEASADKAGAGCKDIEQSVTLADGSVKTDTVTACKSADGWAVV